jgi:uncharacterized RDD family membrane protein YckC
MITQITKKYIGKRAAATLIDYTILYGMTFFYIFQVGKPNGEGGYTVSGLPALVPELFWFIYIVIMEQYIGGTLGHMLLKLKVVSVDGKEIALTQTLKRRLCDILEISWCFGFIAFLLARNSQNSQRMGDIVAKTLVIGTDVIYPDVSWDFEKNA